MESYIALTKGARSNPMEKIVKVMTSYTQEDNINGKLGTILNYIDN